MIENILHREKQRNKAELDNFIKYAFWKKLLEK
jgi:hypothetical protein